VKIQVEVFFIDFEKDYDSVTKELLYNTLTEFSTLMVNITTVHYRNATIVFIHLLVAESLHRYPNAMCSCLESIQ